MKELTLSQLITASLMSPSNDIHGRTMETAYLRNSKTRYNYKLMPCSLSPNLDITLEPASPQVAIMVAIFVFAPYLSS